MIRLRLYIKKLFPPIAIAISICITLLAAYRQPLWLDEQYSLFFAKVFSPSQLLIHFKVDPHPGLYYLYLKLVLLLTQDTFLLRLLTSALPAYLGAASLLWLGIQKKQKSFLLLATPLIFLHPLLINLAWQLRMYGFVILFACLFYIVWDRFQSKKDQHSLLLLSTLLIGAVLIDYCLIWFAGITCIWLFFTNQQKNRLWSIVLGLIIFCEVYFSPGIAGKEKFGDIAWIAPPSLASISSVYQSVFGFSQDYFATHSVISFQDLVALVGLLILATSLGRFLWRMRHELVSTPSILNGVLFSLLPLAVLLIISLVLPWASHLPVLYHFVPNASLFIPRIQISFFMLGLLYLSEYAQSVGKFRQTFKFLIILSLIWAINSYRFNLIIPQDSSEESDQIVRLHRENSEALFFPSWLYMKTIETKKIGQIENLPALIRNSKILEENLSNTEKVCSLSKGKTVFTTKFITSALDWEVKKIESQLNTCCKKESSDGNLTKWNCAVNQ